MKHYVLASHGGFSKGIYESIQIIIGEQPNIHIVQAFVEGNNDITSLVEETLAAIPPEDEVIVCSDVFGGSVNNVFVGRGPLEKMGNLLSSLTCQMSPPLTSHVGSLTK